MAFSVTVDLSILIELGLSVSVRTTGEGFNSNDMPIGCENLAIMETSDGEAATESAPAIDVEVREPELEPELEPETAVEVRDVATVPVLEPEPELERETAVEIRDVATESEPERETESEPKRKPVTELESGPEPEIFESLAGLLTSFARVRPSDLDDQLWSDSLPSPGSSLGCRSSATRCSPSCLTSIWEEYLLECRTVECANGEEEDNEMPLEEDDDVVFLCEVRRV